MDIGWDLGVGTDLGVGSGLGVNSTSPLRSNPMRPLIHNGQVYKSHSLELWLFFFLSQNTMLTLKEQFMAEEARMATEEAGFVRWKAKLARLQKEAQEEVRWKAEEEQKWTEEEARAEEERKQKEEEKR